MNNCWTVYRHNCPDGRCYVGITCQEPEFRWEGGLGYQNSNYDFFRYILATGWNNIEHEILYTGLSEDEARRLEKEEIQKAGIHAFNWVHARKDLRAIPNGADEPWLQAFQTEQQAADLWADALFGRVNSNTRWSVIRRGFVERTVVELESGDPARIEKEMAYIAEEKRKREQQNLIQTCTQLARNLKPFT